jgi:arylsulfatase A-like enzyme
MGVPLSVIAAPPREGERRAQTFFCHEKRAMRVFRKFSRALLIVVIFGLSCPGLVSAAAPKGPNFLFILVDDLGWRDIGCYGSTFYETPNIDRLAAEGVRFTDAYAASPVCSPTRASILTGKYPARLGITDYIDDRHGHNQPEHWTRNTPLMPAPYADRLVLEEVTIAEALKEAGYATFFAGKWHLGPEGYWPENQGFEINKGGCDWGNPQGGNHYFSPYGNPRLANGPVGEHLPDRLATETVNFIRMHREQPFFAYLAFYSVHIPLMARRDLEAKYEQKRKIAPPDSWGMEGKQTVRRVQNHPVYAAMVEAVDQAVEKVLEAIWELGLAPNTVVIFTSDNGGLSTAQGNPTSNLPLRAGKGWLYDGGIREPMIIKWPATTRAGSVCSEPVISTDFYPTILEMANLKPRPDQHVDGMSLVPLLQGKGRLPRKTLFWHYPHYSDQGGTPTAAIRQGDWKLIEFFEDEHVELYHLLDNLEEKNELSRSFPEKTVELKNMLQNWQEELNVMFPKPNSSYSKKPWLSLP